MLNLMIKDIIKNENDIRTLSKKVNKKNTIIGVQFLIVTGLIFGVTKLVEKHEERIEKLETEIKEMKSKGE